MKLIRMSILFAVVLLSVSSAFAQTEMNSKGEPVVTNEQNRPVSLKKGEKITRGAALVRGVKKSTVEKAFASPDKVAGKTVEVSGVIVRSCKKEGCWMEMADKEGGKSVRVTFGDHLFYIPLNSAGMKVKAQGVFKTNVLSKEKVDHLINDDGAKFDNRNADGSVTEVSFDATGVELVQQ
ncbi:MAG: DUF4920 domain-containing protein [Pyrinomonadaceae bacterium]|nr:DUF4920 domain-containing protein [Pyrinomonadaceae bacterium]